MGRILIGIGIMVLIGIGVMVLIGIGIMVLIGIGTMVWCRERCSEGPEVKHRQESMRHTQGVVNDLFGHMQGERTVKGN